jgi:hypothetical protein
MFITRIFKAGSSIYPPQTKEAVNNTLDMGSQITEPKLEENINLGLGKRIFNVFNRLAAEFVTGVAVGALGITQAASGLVFLAQKFELILPNEVTEGPASAVFGKVQAEFWARRGVTLDIEAISEAECYLTEFLNQITPILRALPPLLLRALNINLDSLSVFNFKLEAVYPLMKAAINEELLYRFFMQDICLYRVPRDLIKEIAPGKEKIWDTKIVTAARVLLTAAYFSYAHLSNVEIFSSWYVQAQVVATFVLGIGYGALKESKVGILGPIGAHMINNALSIKPILMAC